MKTLSIKFKVTLWYTICMIVIALLVFFFIFTGSKEFIVSEVKKDLIKIVSDNIDELDYDDGELDIDDDFEFYKNGVYLSIYDSEFRWIDGMIPNQFEYEGEFKNQEFQNLKRGEDQYYVYDYQVFFEEEAPIWIRGIIFSSRADSTIKTIVSMSIIIFPLLIVLVIMGGYSVTKKAFLPVIQMNQIAKSISENGDFSKRIHLDSRNDEIYQLAQTFDQMLDRLEQLYEAEKQFTNDASHELRTPISVIILQSEFALENAATLDEAKESLDVILRQSKKMSSLVSKLLTLSRADNGTAKLQFEVVNISELAEMIIIEEEMLSTKKQITIYSEIEPNIIIKADQTLLTRLFINLISNAIQYGKENGRIDISIKKEKDFIVCKVADNGIGIAPEHIHKIWDRFYQIDDSRTETEEGGVGLGLSMVKWIVQAHHGTIEVESVLGIGSCFTVKLPV